MLYDDDEGSGLEMGGARGVCLCLTRGLGLCTHLAGKKNHLVLPALVLVLGPHVLLVCLLCSSGEKKSTNTTVMRETTTVTQRQRHKPDEPG